MPEDLRGVWRGTPIQAAPPDLLEAAHDGGKGRGLLQDVFPGACEVMQGYTLSPFIFNVVVDAVVRKWVTIVVLEEE